MFQNEKRIKQQQLRMSFGLIRDIVKICKGVFPNRSDKLLKELVSIRTNTEIKSSQIYLVEKKKFLMFILLKKLHLRLAASGYCLIKGNFERKFL